MGVLRKERSRLPVSFVHLHSHSDASALDGMAKPEEYVERAVRLKQPALAITDHGVLSALPGFYKAARGAEIEPILGMEGYYIRKIDRTPAEKGKPRKRPDYNHLTILAKGEPGYRVLCELATESHKNFYYKPVIDRDTIKTFGKDMKHLVVLSGCLAGPLSQAALVGQQALEDELQWWLKRCPNYYIELMEHGIEIERKVNARLLKAARKFKVPVVFTNDPHYCERLDANAHDALLAIQTGAEIDDENRFKFDGSGYWLKSAKQMRKAFDGYPAWAIKQGIASTLEIAETCQVKVPEWENKTWQIPQIPGVDDAYKRVRKLVKRELIDRELGPEYVERAKMELKVIKKMNVSGFLLVASDGVKWARKRNIPVGPGRGSVGGSLVCYLLDIHRADPVRYGLRFDRFLNPERPRMPDIDIDFGKNRRDEMFAYARNRFGEENVLNVCTFMRMRMKRAFRALAKSYGVPFPEINRLAKELPDDKEEAIEDALPDEIHEKWPELGAQLEALKDIRCGFGSHPAGVVIAPEEYELHKRIPQMYLPSSKRWVAMFDLKTFESMGLLKQDYLGLRTLETVDECARLVYEHTGENVDPYAWDPDHEPWEDEMYKIIGSGRTGGIFQFEGHSVTNGAKEMKPREFLDLAACIALYRKGPIQAGSTKTFITNRASGQTQYLVPSLAPILSSTYGALVYQEQVMAIGEQLANFAPGPNDDLLRAVAKKDHAVMATVKPGFLKGFQENGINKTVAEEVWRQIEKQAEYAFNLAHSVGYALLSYTTAGLKTQYPMEFYCALLRTMDKSNKESQFKRNRYLMEAATMGLRILPPHINRSDDHATPDYDKNGIRFGLSDIKGIGDKMSKRIIKSRPLGGYWSIDQVIDVVNNSKSLQALKDAGALNTFGFKPDADKVETLLGWALIDRMRKVREKLQKNYDPPHVIYGQIISSTKKMSGGKKPSPYVSWVVRWSPTEQWAVRIWSSAENCFDIPVGAVVRVMGDYSEKYSSIGVNSSAQVKVVKGKL